MGKSIIVEVIRKKYNDIGPILHERARRIWAASEARQIGRGGIALVEEAIGMSHTTIRRGIRELTAGVVEELPMNRSRIPGGG